MYSYQHRYHAGNFADLHKHMVLLAILKYLHLKPSPFCVLDAFAGEGVYDLDLEEAQKNQEYLSGYGLIEKMANNVPLLFKELLTIISNYKKLYNKNIYTGSPAIIKSQLRPQDSAIFIENHPQAYLELTNYFTANKNIKIHKRDAYEAVNALTPFKEKRGVILIDPSYEVKNEYKTVAELVNKVYHKTSNYSYIIWYPLLKNNNDSKYLFELFNKIKHDRSWACVLELEREPSRGMYGSGIIVINLPWSTDVTLNTLFNKIKPNLKWNSYFLRN